MTDEREVRPGPSLAKGPALLVGTILVAFGLTGLLTNADFPSASSAFPDATAQGETWLGIEVNGWTNFFAIAAGALLLFGAAQHHLAKAMSVLVGLALGACAVIAIIDGDDVLGLAAANWATKLGFAVAGGVLVVTALLPRMRSRRRTVHEEPVTVPDDRPPDVRADARDERFARDPARDEPVADATERHATTGRSRDRDDRWVI